MPSPKSLDELFAEAMARAEGPERDAYIERACDGDALLEQEIRGLISVADDAAGFLAQPLMEGLSSDPDALLAVEQPGTRIGRYTIQSVLGEGGFGIVHLAEQEEPVRREVALKIIKPGMDSRQVIMRFAAERQALAVMDHPGVAKVFDAGTTETGRPYFVMELVRGESITSYCDTHTLSTPQRLDLFLDVCRAIQHAHQKGIIHRDIEPNNILVSKANGTAMPKVIDFGIAKATHQPLGMATMMTTPGQFMGTPEYMSPEQSEGSGINVDTRTDVYSLGVVLYELLTSTNPLASEELREESLEGIQRMIREREPARPSTRISTLGDKLSDAVERRRTDAASLAKSLRGDLDWIVMRCLEKDRTRRYETVNALAMDIDRHLNNQPVEAGPPSTSYKLRKFVRRHRAAVAAGVLVMAAVLVGTAGLVVGFVHSVRAEAQAQTDREIAVAVNDFLTQDLLAAVAPSAEKGRGIDVSMREVLAEAGTRIENAAAPGGRFADKPMVEASIRAVLAETYRLLSEYETGEPHVRRLLELRREHLGEEHSDTLDSLNALGTFVRRQGRTQEAESITRELLDLHLRLLGPDHRRTADVMSQLGIINKNLLRYKEAERLYLEAIDIHRRSGEEHDANSLPPMSNLVVLYRRQGRYEEAESLGLETLELRRRIFGAEHPETIRSLNILVNVYAAQGLHDQAIPLLEEVLEKRRRLLGDEHADTLRSLNTLVAIFIQLERFEEAEPLVRQLIDAQVRTQGLDATNTLIAKANLGSLYLSQGGHAGALDVFEDALEGARRRWPAGHWIAAELTGGCGDALAGLARYEEAETALLEAHEMIVATRGADHPSAAKRTASLVDLYTAWDKQLKADLWRGRSADPNPAQ